MRIHPRKFECFQRTYVPKIPLKIIVPDNGVNEPQNVAPCLRR